MPATAEPRGLFITGTGTGVGKTIFTAALALYLRQCDIDVGVMKPVETGVANVDHPGQDGELLRWAAAINEPPEITCPYRFKMAAAPATASRQEKRSVNYTELLATGKKIIAHHQFTLIEGAGGLMVPLVGGFLVADLAKDLGLPLLVVAEARLGTINHTLLSLLAARYLEIEIAGYLLNRMPEKPSEAEKSTPHDLASLTVEELLLVLPEFEGSTQQIVKEMAKILPTLPSWALLKRYLPQ